MPRGSTLESAVGDLKDEIRQTRAINLGIDNESALKRLIRRQQNLLYHAYDWPFLCSFQSIDLAAGQRYYDLPSGYSVEGLIEANVVYSGRPVPVARGIGFEEYAGFNSDDDERADPLLKWDVRAVGNAVQIEAWPIPSSNDQVLWFKCKRDLRQLVEDSDVLDLDDDLIVLFAAAEILAHQKSADAKVKADMAATHFQRLKGRVTGGSEPVKIGGGADRPRAHGTTIVIGR